MADMKILVMGATSAMRARARIAKTGFTPKGHHVWTSDEDQVLRDLFPNCRELADILRRRTPKAISLRARKLGLTDRRKVWTAAEITTLRRAYRQGGIVGARMAFPQLRSRQIEGALWYNKISSGRKPYRKTGIQVLDEIRERCFDLNLSMADLDKMVRSKSYFYKAGWCGGNINHKFIGRAIDVLYGEMEVKWRE